LEVFPGVRSALFIPADRPGYSQLQVAVGDINATIFGHAEFRAFHESVTALFAKWKEFHRPGLQRIAAGTRPKALVETLSENALKGFRRARLIDPYDVYQRLMDYWAEPCRTMCT